MLAVLLLELLAVAAVRENQASPPRLLNQPEIVTADDYPLAAIDQEQEGSVTVRLYINPDGFVTDCRIARSSGHAALDQQTCALFRARARFDPAVDRNGRAVASTFVQRIVWALAGERVPPVPRHAWSIRSTLSLDQLGQFVDCKVVSSGMDAPPVCEEMVAHAGLDLSDAPTGGVASVLVIEERRFIPTPADGVTAPTEMEGAELLAHQVSEITIGPDGRVQQCRGTQYSGDHSIMDACTIIRQMRFERASPGAPSQVGTVVMTAYMRRQSIT